jgi:hypothetical protein
MQKLQHERAAMPFHRPRHIGEPFELGVVPQSGKTKRRVDRVLIDEMPAEDDHAEAGPGALLVISDRLFGEDALVRASHPGRADRRENHPIRQGGITDAQRRERMAIRPSVGHGRFPWLLLCWSKEHPAAEAARGLRLPPSIIDLRRLQIRY